MDLSIPDELYEKITKLTDSGNDLADRGKFREAYSAFSSAWDLLPSPKQHWDAARWISISKADMQFSLGEFSSAREELEQFASWHPLDSLPPNERMFFLLLSGKVNYELGEETKSLKELGEVYEVMGPDLIHEQKYLDFLYEREGTENKNLEG